jgi:deoxyribonuclease-4
VEACIDRIAESLLEMEELIHKGPTKILLEATAGQGSVVGAKFEELGAIIQKVHKKIPIGVTIDTCHIFAAGYDIRTEKAWLDTLNQFDELVGPNYLCAFHVNDSKKGLGSRVDRHAPLGEGMIGWEAFRFLVTNPRTRKLPLYLETPGGPPLWKEEIAKLKQMYSRSL